MKTLTVFFRANSHMRAFYDFIVTHCHLAPTAHSISLLQFRINNAAQRSGLKWLRIEINVTKEMSRWREYSFYWMHWMERNQWNEHILIVCLCSPCHVCLNYIGWSEKLNRKSFSSLILTWHLWTVQMVAVTTERIFFLGGRSKQIRRVYKWNKKKIG